MDREMSGDLAGGDSAPLQDASVAFMDFGATDDSSSEIKHGPPPSFVSVRTIPLALVHVLLFVAYEVEVFTWSVELEYRFILMQALLMLVLIFSYVAFRYEHQRLRYKGYLDFYIKANRITRFGFFFAANATWLQSIVFIYHYENDPNFSFNRQHVMEGITTFENVLLAATTVLYIGMCYSHNKNKLLPDAALSESLPGVSSGAVAMDSSDLLRKQAVMIQHLEAQVRALGEELLRQKQASSKLHSVPANRKSTANDMDMLLASKEQEVRALTSERDLLRRNVQKAVDENENTNKLVERLRKENAETAEQLSVQKKKFRQLTKDFTQQQILLEVHKETNASAQKVIESLTTTGEEPVDLEKL